MEDPNALAAAVLSLNAATLSFLMTNGALLPDQIQTIFGMATAGIDRLGLTPDTHDLAQVALAGLMATFAPLPASH